MCVCMYMLMYLFIYMSYELKYTLGLIQYYSIYLYSNYYSLTIRSSFMFMPVFLWQTLSFQLWCTSLLSGTTRFSRFICFPCPSNRICCFSKELQEMVFRSQDLGTVWAYCSWAYCAFLSFMSLHFYFLYRYHKVLIFVSILGLL